MNEFAIRVDISSSSSGSQVSEYLQSISSSSLYCNEKVDVNWHQHWYILTSTNSQTIRNKIKSFGLVGNKSYSLKKVKDKLKYIAYIIKDDRDYVSINIDDNLINQAIAYDTQVKTELKEKKEREKGIFKLLLNKCKSELCSTPESVVRLCLKYYVDNNKIITGQFSNLCRTILIHLNPASYDHFVSDIVYQIKIKI